MFKMKKLLMIILLWEFLCLLGCMGAFASSHDKDDDLPCPDGWEKLHRNCYIFVNISASWGDANDYCKKKQGDLLVIQSEKERINLENHLSKPELPQQWWVGMKKDDGSGQWKWVNGDAVSKITPWDVESKRHRNELYCGVVVMKEQHIKVSNVKCSTNQPFICETHVITTRPNVIIMTTPLDTNLGATIETEETTSRQGEITGQGDIVGVSKANGQMTSITGGVFSSMMTLVSKSGLNTSPQASSNPEDKNVVKVPATVDAPVSSTVSKNDTENVKNVIVPHEETTPKVIVESLKSTTETFEVTESIKLSTTGVVEEKPNVTSRIHDVSTTLSTVSTTLSTPTHPLWTSPETPQPTMVDWARSYQEFAECYIPGTGGSIRNIVMTARELYKDDHTSCPQIKIGSILWPSVKAGDKATFICGNGQASFQCSTKPVCWKNEPDIANCTSKKLQAILKKTKAIEANMEVAPPSVAMVVELTTMLTEVTESESNTMEDVIEMSRVLTTLTHVKGEPGGNDKNQVELAIRNIIKTGSNMVADNKSTLWDGMSREDRVRSASSLLVAMETAAVAMAEKFDKPTVIVTKNVNMELEVRIVDLDLLQGEADNLVYGSNQTDNSFSIPVETLKNLTEGKLAKVVFFTHYSISELMGGRSNRQQVAPPTQASVGEGNLKGALNSGDDVAGNMDGSQDEVLEDDSGPKIASHIISASIGGKRSSGVKLPKSVTFVMKHLEKVDNRHTPLCSFWDIRQKSKSGFWSQDGCSVLMTNKTHTSCKCNHMTNFAILLDIHGLEIPEIHQSVLRLVTIIGCFISSISLLASWVTFQCFASLQGERNSIHKNLAVTLLTAEVLFVFGIDQTHHQIACSVIAGFLHFFFLAAFTWMFIEGLHIIFMLVQVFDASRSRLPYYYLVGYGVPFVVVGVSSLFFYNGYGTDKYCWLTNEHYFIWAFAGPLAVILLVNAAFLTYAMSTVCRHSDYVFNTKDKSNVSGIRAWVQGALALEVLLGLTWTLGYFSINDESLPLTYGFAILNSLQGLFIFIFHCLLNKKTQKEYRQVVRSVVKRAPSTVTTQSTITKRTHHTNNSYELNNSPTNSHQKLNTTNSQSLA